MPNIVPVDRLSDAFMREVDVARQVVENPSGPFAGQQTTFDQIKNSFNKLQIQGLIDANGNVSDLVDIMRKVNMRAKVSMIRTAWQQVNVRKQMREQAAQRAQAAAAAKAAEAQRQYDLAHGGGAATPVHGPADMAKAGVAPGPPASSVLLPPPGTARGNVDVPAGGLNPALLAPGDKAAVSTLPAGALGGNTMLYVAGGAAALVVLGIVLSR